LDALTPDSRAEQILRTRLLRLSGNDAGKLLLGTNSHFAFRINLGREWEGEDSFNIPYRILADLYYVVPGHKRGSEGKPALPALRDLNGDGLPLETAFFEAMVCSEILTWVDYLFSEKPIRPGYWRYQIDYTGRGGTLDSYDVYYDPAHEKFFGTLTSLVPPWAADR
jgi:hypothetical protein